LTKRLNAVNISNTDKSWQTVYVVRMTTAQTWCTLRSVRERCGCRKIQ